MGKFDEMLSPNIENYTYDEKHKHSIIMPIIWSLSVKNGSLLLSIDTDTMREKFEERLKKLDEFMLESKKTI